MTCVGAFPLESRDSTSRRRNRGGRRGRNTVIPVLAVVALILIAPAGAAGHAGEIHSEVPAPAAVEKPAATDPTPPQRDGAKKARPEVVVESATPTGSGVPPAPEVPRSNPTLHFLGLAAVAILGTGFILLRRRNSLG